MQDRLRARGTDLEHCTGVADPATIRSSVEITSAVHDQTRCRLIPIGSPTWAKRMQDRLRARGTDLEHSAGAVAATVRRSSVEVASTVHDQTRYRLISIGSPTCAK